MKRINRKSVSNIVQPPTSKFLWLCAALDCPAGPPNEIIEILFIICSAAKRVLIIVHASDNYIYFSF